MCMMLRRSKVSIKKSKDALETYEICHGEEWLDSACVDAQQAVEFLIKGILLEYGKAFEKEHNISYLVSLLDDVGLTFEKHEDLQLLAATLTSWEQSGRYGSGIKTSINTVKRVYNIYDSILYAYLEIQDKNQNGEDTD